MGRGSNSQDADAGAPKKQGRRHWRFYKSEAGNSPVEKFLSAVPTDDRAEIVAELAAVRHEGRRAARHLQGELYEVRVQGQDVIYRVLFAALGRYEHVLLAVHAFVKKTQKTPRKEILVANERLKDWKDRGARMQRDAAKRRPGRS